MNKNLVLKLAVSIVGVVGAAVHFGWPALHIDSITIILLIVAILPWTQPLIKSIELLGVKLELQELQNKVAEAKGAAENANRQVGLALAASESGPEANAIRQPAAEGEIAALAEEYNKIRREQRSGDARTAAMTQVVRRMIEIAKQTNTFDVIKALQDKNRGMRLFAYAYLYSRPLPQFLVPLVESVTKKEDKPFGQYWGLQAISRVSSLATPAMLRQVKDSLRIYAENVPPGTDRDYLIKRLLRNTEPNT